MNYLRSAGGRRATPQHKAIPGRPDQVENSAGGFVWKVDPLTRLRRFVVLGVEGGSYYASEQQLMTANVSCLSELAASGDSPGDYSQALLAIDLIRDISMQGRAPKPDPGIFALAFFCGHPNVDVRRVALAAMPLVCRTGTHMLHFIAFVEKQRGWGRSLRRAVGQWFTDNPVEAVAYQAIKYRQRDGWAQRDALRLAHPAAKVSSGNPTLPVTAEHAALFNWICGRSTPKEDLPRQVRGFRKAWKVDSGDVKKMQALIQKYDLPREAIPDEFIDKPEIWEALLLSGQHGMPMTAMVRNLPTMTRVGLLRPMSWETEYVCSKLVNEEALEKSRIHPLQLLVAHLTYKAGVSIRGSSRWEPVGQIVDALDEAFYRSFGNVEKTGKRQMIALDVSSSMDSKMINGVPGLTPRVASSAMAMVTAAAGDPYVVVAFTGDNGWNRRSELKQLDISPRMRLDTICRTTNELPFGATDCSLPMRAAITGKYGIVDTFIIYTDNETWTGPVHPSQALQTYRERNDVDSRLVTVGMVANEFTIADPQDPGMMDVVGFDTATPQIISDFSAGRL